MCLVKPSQPAKCQSSNGRRVIEARTTFLLLDIQWEAFHSFCPTRSLFMSQIRQKYHYPHTRKLQIANFWNWIAWQTHSSRQFIVHSKCTLTCWNEKLSWVVHWQQKSNPFHHGSWSFGRSHCHERCGYSHLSLDTKPFHPSRQHSPMISSLGRLVLYNSSIS